MSEQPHVPLADEPTVPDLEDDQTIPPRPEEEIADVLRAKPDVEPHATASTADGSPESQSRRLRFD